MQALRQKSGGKYQVDQDWDFSMEGSPEEPRVKEEREEMLQRPEEADVSTQASLASVKSEDTVPSLCPGVEVKLEPDGDVTDDSDEWEPTGGGPGSGVNRILTALGVLSRQMAAFEERVSNSFQMIERRFQLQDEKLEQLRGAMESLPRCCGKSARPACAETSAESASPAKLVKRTRNSRLAEEVRRLQTFADNNALELDPQQRRQQLPKQLPDIELLDIPPARIASFADLAQEDMGRYGALVFRYAITPATYHQWVKRVNFKGNHGKSELPKNLKTFVVDTCRRYNPNMNDRDFALIQKRINEALRCEREWANDPR